MCYNDTAMKPKVKFLIKTRHYRAKRVFRHDISHAFSPSDGTLRYQFINSIPSWVTVDTLTGVISGMAPGIARSRKFLLTIQAENSDGIATQSFFIKILASNFIDDFSERLQYMYSLKNRKLFSDTHAIRHSMLEFLYECLMNSDERLDFIELTKEHAEEKNITISDEPNYEEFKSVVDAYDKTVEQKIQKQLPSKHALLQAELTNIEMRNLFRQGSQPTGAEARPVWNYLAAPDRYNWSSVYNVLDQAALEVYKLRTENVIHNNMHQNDSIKTQPKLK